MEVDDAAQENEDDEPWPEDDEPWPDDGSETPGAGIPGTPKALAGAEIPGTPEALAGNEIPGTPDSGGSAQFARLLEEQQALEAPGSPPQTVASDTPHVT